MPGVFSRAQPALLSASVSPGPPLSQLPLSQSIPCHDTTPLFTTYHPSAALPLIICPTAFIFLSSSSSPQLLLFSSSGLWLVVLYFPLGGLTRRLDFINANQSAWQDVTQMRVFFLTLPSITTAYAFTHGDARQLAYKRNVSSGFAGPTFSPSLEDSGLQSVSAKSICCWL